jgi:hypothetical protein
VATLIPRDYPKGIERFDGSGDIHEMLRFYKEVAGVIAAKVPARD